MLQLHRTLHCSTSVSLGHLTTGPSWFVEVNKPLAPQERSTDRNTFTQRRILPWNQPSIQLERCPVPTVSLLYSGIQATSASSAHSTLESIPQVKRMFKGCVRQFLPRAEARGFLARSC
jgi:hypothetical protein